MPRTLTCTVRLEIDGVQHPAFPIVRTLELTELQTSPTLPRQPGGVLRAIPIEEIEAGRLVTLTPSAPVIVRLGGTANIPVAARGLVLIFGGGTVPGPQTVAPAAGPLVELVGAVGGV